MNILIVKTSSLGDIIQSFPVLQFLRQLFPHASIDWVVEQKFVSVAAAHPLLRNAISIDRTRILNSICQFRKISYDFVFDLQGNSKSALITFFSKGKVKVGFGVKAVREWPNIFSTHFRFNVPSKLNIRLQYLHLIAQFFSVPLPERIDTVLFKMNDLERKQLDLLKSSKRVCQIMVCPGSQWRNKQLSLEVMANFLSLVQKKCGAFFLLMWGSPEERAFCEKLQESLVDQSEIIEKLSLPVWQNLMNQMDLVIAVDSSALHLCGVTSTASFSIFGPTSPFIFKPIGQNHFAFQGRCPYGKIFEKRCPILRTCPTGSCIKNVTSDELFRAFSNWHTQLTRRVY